MKNNPGIAELNSPLYVPRIMPGTSLGVWYDTRENHYRVLCPRCHFPVDYQTIEVLYREMVLSERKACPGCRARAAFEKSPQGIGAFLGF